MQNPYFEKSWNKIKTAKNLGEGATSPLADTLRGRPRD